MPASDRAKQLAKDEVNRVSKVTQEVARSGSYLYPLKGIYFYATHRSLWGPLASRLLPALSLGVGILGSMFFFTYLPQAAILAITNGPVAALTTALLVLSESSTIFMVAAKTLLVEDSLIDTFDGTLVAKGQAGLVNNERQVKGSGSNPIARLGKLATKPFQRFSPDAIMRYFLYLPLNFIPVIGTVLFVLAQGKRFGPGVHTRYFQLKGMDKSKREEWIQKRSGQYTGFGTVAVLLEMVPVAGILFAFTNTAGAALWAADMEKEEGTSPALREQAHKAKGGKDEL